MILMTMIIDILNLEQNNKYSNFTTIVCFLIFCKKKLRKSYDRYLKL